MGYCYSLSQNYINFKNMGEKRMQSNSIVLKDFVKDLLFLFLYFV